MEHSKGHRLIAYNQMALGMAEYRSGLFAEADKTLAAAQVAAQAAGIRSHPNGLFTPFYSTVSFFRAMALFRLGQPDDALRQLQPVEKKMHGLPKDDANLLQPGLSANYRIMWLVYREARALLGPERIVPLPKEPQ